MSVRSYETIVPAIDASAWVAPEAVVIGRVQLGRQVSIWPCAVLRGDVCRIEVGARSNIQDGAVVHGSSASPMLPDGSDTVLGEGVTVGHNAILHGCHVGDYSLVGMGATVLDGAVLAAGCMVAAGALVPPGKHLEGGWLWVGSPVQRARPLSDRERDYMRESADHYVNLIAAHRNAESC